MATIKHMNNTTNLKKFVSKKIPVKEKWEQYKKRIAQSLNSKTRHWEKKQKTQFLILFCTGFTGLFLLSFCFLSKQKDEDKLVAVPTLPQKLLFPEKQVLKTWPPFKPQKLPPPLMDSGKHKL